MRKTGKDVDFSKYELVYIVGSKNKGYPTSPTWLASPGKGIRVGSAEVRHVVTFGNDIRGANWGWQALAHETGHVFGLPDLYSYKPDGDRYKDIQKYVTLYNALYLKGTVVDDTSRRIKIEILGREGTAYRIGVTR